LRGDGLPLGGLAERFAGCDLLNKPRRLLALEPIASPTPANINTGKGSDKFCIHGCSSANPNKIKKLTIAIRMGLAEKAGLKILNPS